MLTPDLGSKEYKQGITTLKNAILLLSYYYFIICILYFINILSDRPTQNGEKSNTKMYPNINQIIFWGAQRLMREH